MLTARWSPSPARDARIGWSGGGGRLLDAEEGISVGDALGRRDAGSFRDFYVFRAGARSSAVLSTAVDAIEEVGIVVAGAVHCEVFAAASWASLSVAAMIGLVAVPLAARAPERLRDVRPYGEVAPADVDLVGTRRFE